MKRCILSSRPSKTSEDGKSGANGCIGRCILQSPSLPSLCAPLRAPRFTTGMLSERSGMPPECNGGDLEGSQSAPGSASGSPRVEAFSWLQSAEKHGAPTPSFGWLSKPKAYTAASTSSSPGSISSPATPPQAPPQRANSDPFKRATTAAARPLQYLDKLSRVEVEQPPGRSHGQVERVWSDTDNSPTEVELSVDNDDGTYLVQYQPMNSGK